MNFELKLLAVELFLSQQDHKTTRPQVRRLLFLIESLFLAVTPAASEK